MWDLWYTLTEYPVLSTLAVLYLLNYVYCRVSCGVCHSKARMDGKTVIVTGCTSGIGKATALDLAKRGARVIMACRNLEKANTVKKMIIEVSKNEQVVVRLLDVSLMSSVRRFAEEINRAESRLDVLVHNAGVVMSPKPKTEEGLNMFWATNHFGAFLLTHLLIDLLKQTGNSRIVIVSSVLHRLGVIHADEVNKFEETTAVKLYNKSKFANVVFANELARRLKGTGVAVNSLHPGAIQTPIWDINPLWLFMTLQIFRPFFKSIEEGAQTTIYLAVSEEVEGVSGKYFADCKATNPSKSSKQLDLARQLWKTWEEVTQLKPTDPHILES